MSGAWAITSAVAATAGATVVPWLTSRGLHQLGREEAPSGRLRLAVGLAGAAASVAAVAASAHPGVGRELPPLLAWSWALTAGSCCDALTQRVPTPLVRQAAMVTLLLLAVSSLAAGAYGDLGVAAVASATVGAVLAACWRFAGLGFGDVRLGSLGGLGLGHATTPGLVAGAVVFTLTVAGQVVITLARGGNRHTRFPVGPALATTFLVAAAL